MLQCAQVYFHLTVRREDGERVLETTRLSEEGVEGSGVPRAFVLGKGLRAPRGWELAISSERPMPRRTGGPLALRQNARSSLSFAAEMLMRLKGICQVNESVCVADMVKGEKARFKMRPEYGYAGKECKVAPPAGCARDEAFLFDIHLVRPPPGAFWMGISACCCTPPVAQQVTPTREIRPLQLCWSLLRSTACVS